MLNFTENMSLIKPPEPVVFFSGVISILSMYSTYTKWLSGVYCIQGTETSLDECVENFGNLRPWWYSVCDDGKTAGLICTVTETTTITSTTTTEKIPGEVLFVMYLSGHSHVC